jgi:23S rRNA (adenine-N6)-dimethyltransferase
VAVRRSRTERDVRRRALAQNFLRSRAVAEQIVRRAGVTRGDLVLELGAGTGVLTAALARRAGRVLAVELDRDWARRLLDRFEDAANVFVVRGDALAFPLPAEPFRVVANLPFNRTTDFLHRLLDNPASALMEADLIVQAEVARKRARNQGTVLTVSWAPWFEFSVGERVPPQAFRPVPRTRAAVLRVRRRPSPLLDPSEREKFAVFVRTQFERKSAESARRSADEWVRRFRARAPLP